MPAGQAPAQPQCQQQDQVYDLSTNVSSCAASTSAVVAPDTHLNSRTMHRQIALPFQAQAGTGFGPTNDGSQGLRRPAFRLGHLSIPLELIRRPVGTTAQGLTLTPAIAVPKAGRSSKTHKPASTATLVEECKHKEGLSCTSRQLSYNNRRPKTITQTMCVVLTFQRYQVFGRLFQGLREPT